MNPSVSATWGLLVERGFDLANETLRLWWNRFLPLFAGDIRCQRVSAMRGFRRWRGDERAGQRRQAGGSRRGNNRVENSHLSLRRRKWAALRFRRMKTPQTFANVYNHFSLERHLFNRQA